MNERLKKLIKQLNNKYRLVLLNDITLEERLSFRLSRLNVFVLGSTVAVILVAFTVASIVLTPLKQYIPGYQDVTQTRRLLDLTYRTDSMQQMVLAQNRYIESLKDVLSGDFDEQGEKVEARSTGETDYSSINLNSISTEDSLIRLELENEEIYELFTESKKEVEKLSDIYFSKPLEGYITDSFSLEKEHFGIDLVGADDAPVKAILDGVVVMNEWSLETGYIVGIQHSYNLLSFYKHNSVILKKVGTLVQAGDVVAIIGDSGELSDGKHLHFELWHNQSPVNPLEYVIY